MINEAEFQRKVTEAQHRLKALWLETNGRCYISFSGGKDSTVLLALSKMCADIGTLPPEGIKAVYSNTGIEMGVTIDFVKWCKENWYHNIEIIRPEVSFDWIIKNKGKPMLSKSRAEFLHRWQIGTRTESVYHNFIIGITKKGLLAKHTKLSDKDMHFIHPDFNIKSSEKCCSFLKKKPFDKYADERDMKGFATGLRMNEGGTRLLNAKKCEGLGQSICTTTTRGRINKMPLIDWTGEELEEFIARYHVPLSKAYTEYGFDRTGCMACPFAKDVDHNLKYLHDHEPNRYKAIMHWLKDVYIAQNVVLPFDEPYEQERKKKWNEEYEPMRQEMLRKYRPNSSLIKEYWQTSLEV